MFIIIKLFYKLTQQSQKSIFAYFLQWLFISIIEKFLIYKYIIAIFYICCIFFKFYLLVNCMIKMYCTFLRIKIFIIIIIINFSKDRLFFFRSSWLQKEITLNNLFSNISYKYTLIIKYLNYKKLIIFNSFIFFEDLSV